MGWQGLLQSHPLAKDADSPDFWEEYLADHPDVLNRLLADVYQATYGADKPPTLDALWDIMSSKRFSTEEFGPAVYEVLGDRSVRWLAREVGGSAEQLRRFVTGQRPIVSVHDHRGSMNRIEAVAKALDVHPSYFMEWRRLWVMSLIDSAFASRPDLSIGVFRRYSGFASPDGRRRGTLLHRQAPL